MEGFIPIIMIFLKNLFNFSDEVQLLLIMYSVVLSNTNL